MRATQIYIMGGSLEDYLMEAGNFGLESYKDSEGAYNKSIEKNKIQANKPSDKEIINEHNDVDLLSISDFSPTHNEIVLDLSRDDLELVREIAHLLGASIDIHNKLNKNHYVGKGDNEEHYNMKYDRYWMAKEGGSCPRDKYIYKLIVYRGGGGHLSMMYNERECSEKADFVENFLLDIYKQIKDLDIRNPNVLPKVFAKPNLDKAALGELIDIISDVELKVEHENSKDLLGRIYECFLGEFANAERKKASPFRRGGSEADGKMRPLGIPTVKDRIAQMIAKLYLEEELEKELLKEIKFIENNMEEGESE